LICLLVISLCLQLLFVCVFFKHFELCLILEGIFSNFYVVILSYVYFPNIPRNSKNKDSEKLAILLSVYGAGIG